jgi:hypothetical protein
MFIRSELLEFWTLSITGNCKNKKTFRKLFLFPSSGDGKKTPTLLGSIERANFNHGTVIDVSFF